MAAFLPQDNNEKSLWVDTAIAPPCCEILRDSLQTDVLVIGAGFTGLSSALHLAEQGVSVVLLEAASIGYGGSGRNAGLVNAGLWKNPEEVSKQLGVEAAGRLNQALRDSPALVFDLVRRFAMQCEAKACGTVHMAHSKAGGSYLEDRCRQLQDLGAGVELIDGARSRAVSGSAEYRYGGILDPNAGTIQPLGYVRELARAACSQGVSLFQQSALKAIKRRDDRWLATTEFGQVSADQVIIATNAYADANSLDVRESTVPVYIFQCATPPLPGHLAASIIPQREGLWDTDTLLTSSRIDADGRLVMSYPGHLPAGQRALRQAWATRKRNRLFPELRGIPWEYYWSGRVGVTTGKILRVQLLAPGLYAPAGFNGRGIGTGSVMGKHLAQTIVSGDRGDFPFPIEALYPEKWRRSRAAYYDYGTLALQFFDKRW
ncbi:MAG: FAD-binding oxidoreductase [Gammaproteobacteria bacterium]|jgi:glycine/D-amino acid oxidase-like deaminating enzyme|nr:FAD-binding oxidoreductase [Gammaproteobacteria bacterium]